LAHAHHRAGDLGAEMSELNLGRDYDLDQSKTLKTFADGSVCGIGVIAAELQELIS
jgi:hypothetical protein